MQALLCDAGRLYTVHDGALPTAAGYHAAGTQSAFRSLKGPVRLADGTMSPDYRKFSWEKGSVPMPMRDDGHPDLDECARCFAEKPLSPFQMSLMFDKWHAQPRIDNKHSSLEVTSKTERPSCTAPKQVPP